MKIFPVIALALAAPSMALAQGPAARAAAAEPEVARPMGGPSLGLALEAARAAMDLCKSKGYVVGVTVVDDRGVVRLSVNDDGAPPQGSNGSRRKAILTAVEKTSGVDLVERVKTDPAFAAKVGSNKDWMAREGAVLLKAGGKVVGAIGVEGVPHDLKLDESCAQAGADRIAGRLK